MTEETSNTYLDILQHKNVHKRLKIRLYLYAAISLILIIAVIYDVLSDRVSFLFPLLAVLIGIIIGVIVSRIFHISWDEKADQVISRLDTFGVIILIAYIVFDVFRERLIEEFIHGPVVAATSLALLTGVMIGRVLGIGGKIQTVLEKNL